MMGILGQSGNRPFPYCNQVTDTFHLSRSQATVSLSFPHCRPSKSSLDTLGPSGSLLGLAPSTHLSQIKSPSFMRQLLEKEIVKLPIFSILLINAEEGVLTVGGTASNIVEKVVQQTKDELDRLGAMNAELKERDSPSSDPAFQIRQSDWHTSWRWTKLQAAEGWWQILMQGVWINGIKVLKNLPVVLDVRKPPSPLKFLLSRSVTAC